MTRLVDLDFETASAADLKTVGVWAYAEDPTTEVLCLVFHCGHDKWKWWPSGDRTSIPYVALRVLAKDPDTIFVAHNAGFEQAIWHCSMVRLFGFPEIPIERWEDTMATCAWKTWPLKLEKAGPLAGLPDKDMEGNRLTLSMSRVNKKTGMLPELTPDVQTRIADYCARDVEIEAGLRKRIGLLKDQSPHERGIWLLDQKINQRGVRIDLEFVRQAQLVVDRATVPLLAEFRDLTGGINPGQRDKVLEWIHVEGVELANLQKDTIKECLDDPAMDADDAGYESLADDKQVGAVHPAPYLPTNVARCLAIRQQLSSISIKKLKRMQACVCSDGRARGLLQYHAASPGRWGGRLLQPQNFPRGTLKVSPDEAVDAIMTGDPEYVEEVLGQPAIECVASSLRHALVPAPGRVFVVGDFAGIEMRVDLALAGQHDKCKLLADGADVYLDMACDIYNLPKGSLTKADIEKRQTGKNTVLGCGFQMGAAKFHERYCPDQPFEFAERVIQAYRKEWAPKVPKLWYGLERAALCAVKDGEGEAYGVHYHWQDEWLVADLPSGWQRIWYYRPQLFRDEMFEKDAWMYTAHKGGRMTRNKAYGGLLTENTVQGLARGLLAASMMRLESAGMPIVLSVHDEVVCEVDEDKADLKRFKQLMTEPTPWADRIGIPIAVEEWQGDRYRK